MNPARRLLNGRLGGEASGPRLELGPDGVDQGGDHPIPPGGHDQLDQLLGLPVLDQLTPQRVRDIGGLVDLVRQPNQKAVAFGPDRIIEVSVCGRGQLRFAQTHALCEDLDVDAPLLLRAATRRDPLDHYLALAPLHSGMTEQARAEDAHP